jgi:hypothetical protein
MPTYCFTTDSGWTVERDYPPGNAPGKIRVEIDGEKEWAHRNWGAEGKTGFVSGSKNPVKRTWPMEPCWASGVHSSDAGKLRKYLKDRGCPTEVTEGGNPIYTSQRHQNKALKIRGMHNRAAV